MRRNIADYLQDLFENDYCATVGTTIHVRRCQLTNCCFVVA